MAMISLENSETLCTFRRMLETTYICVHPFLLDGQNRIFVETNRVGMN